MKEIDSVSITMCNYLHTIQVKNDSLKINNLYEAKLYPYLDKIEKSKVKKVAQQVYYRLQRNCVEFRKLLDRLEPPKEGVVRKTTKPISKLTKKELLEFKHQIKFKYFEVNGDTTFVTIQNGLWIDEFADKTYSKLKCKWISETEFELTFIESNNEMRSNFSVEGDKFIYYLISKEKDYYLMSVKIPEENVYEESKIYLDK